MLRGGKIFSRRTVKDPELSTDPYLVSVVHEVRKDGAVRAAAQLNVSPAIQGSKVLCRRTQLLTGRS
jgi:hypothetical protein